MILPGSALQTSARRTVAKAKKIQPTQRSTRTVILLASTTQSCSCPQQEQCHIFDHVVTAKLRSSAGWGEHSDALKQSTFENLKLIF